MVVFMQFCEKSVRLLILGAFPENWTEGGPGPGEVQLREMAQLCRGRAVTAFQPLGLSPLYP